MATKLVPLTAPPKQNGQRDETRADLARFRQGEEHTLPVSGLTVRLRRVSVLDLAIGMGEIPALLGPKIDQLSENSGQLTAANLAEFMPLINSFCRMCVIDPPITDEPSETTLGIDELPVEDKVDILGWAMQGGAPLAKFRGEPEEPVEAAQPGDGVQPAA